MEGMLRGAGIDASAYLALPDTPFDPFMYLTMTVGAVNFGSAGGATEAAVRCCASGAGRGGASLTPPAAGAPAALLARRARPLASGWCCLAARRCPAGRCTSWQRGRSLGRLSGSPWMGLPMPSRPL